jgi:hypothetical protein
MRTEYTYAVAVVAYGSPLDWAITSSNLSEAKATKLAEVTRLQFPDYRVAVWTMKGDTHMGSHEVIPASNDGRYTRDVFARGAVACVGLFDRS